MLCYTTAEVVELMRILLLISLFIAILLSLADPAEARIIERIVAKVNKEVITLSELEEALASAKVLAQLTGEEPTESEILNQLIEDRLILVKAKEAGITVTASRVEYEIDKIKSRFPSQEAFIKALSQEGISEAELAKRYEERLMKEALTARSVKLDPITEEDLEEKLKGQDLQIQVRQILVKTKEEADSIAVRIKGGADFLEMAQAFSLSPDQGETLGFFSRGQMVAEFETAAFSLKEGEIGIAETGLGFHVIECLAIRKTPEEELARLREEWQARLYRERLDQALESWIKELKAGAYIETRL